MKKILFLFVLIIVIYVVLGNTFSNYYAIPNDAIRVRVIANSNSKYDQNIKMKVKDIVANDMYEFLKDTKNVTSARKIIKDNINILENDIDKILQKENYELNYSVNFGLNYFPLKKYKGIKYDDGYYESLVVTLGDGLGDNWWCVLFPPLCLIEAEESTDVEYTTVVKTIVSKYF